MQLEERGREGGGVRACGLSLKKRRRREGNDGDSHNKKGKTREEGGFCVLNTTK